MEKWLLSTDLKNTFHPNANKSNTNTLSLIYVIIIIIMITIIATKKSNKNIFHHFYFEVFVRCWCCFVGEQVFLSVLPFIKLFIVLYGYAEALFIFHLYLTENTWSHQTKTKMCTLKNDSMCLCTAIRITNNMWNVLMWLALALVCVINFAMETFLVDSLDLYIKK